MGAGRSAPPPDPAGTITPPKLRKRCNCCSYSPEVVARISHEIIATYGHTYQIKLPPESGMPKRHYVIHEPANFYNLVKRKKLPVLFYAHGKQGNAWDSAIDETDWRRISAEEGFMVIFGQAQGELFPHPFVLYGDYQLSTCFWASIYPEPDLQYVQAVLDDVYRNVYPDKLDPSLRFFMGFSSGGLFSYCVSVRLGALFCGVFNYMGGVQDSPDPNAVPDAKTATEKKPVYILTGSNDCHLEHCSRAKTLLEEAGFPVQYQVLEGKRHEFYRAEIEPIALQFFRSLMQDMQAVK